MKFRTLRNSLKESLKNIIRHPLVTVASISTVALMLTLIGAFVIVSLNANHMVKVIAQRPAVSVWVDRDSSDADRTAIENFIAHYPGVVEHSMLTPQQNYANLAKDLGKDASVLDSFDRNSLPYVFNVRFAQPDMANAFQKKMAAFNGVYGVDFAKSLMDKLNNMIRSVNLASLIAFIIMCVVTLFIISNMVRISVFSRAEEINIMKYVGATNAYIRLPYILEGALTGFFGALIAWGLAVPLGYKGIYARLIKTAGNSVGMFSGEQMLVPISSLSWRVLLINLAMGILIGSIGSAISVRKHIKV